MALEPSTDRPPHGATLGATVALLAGTAGLMALHGAKTLLKLVA